MIMRTLRARLTSWNLLIVSLALTVFAVLLYSWLARTLYQHHDADLAVDLDKVVALVRGQGDSPSSLERIDAADRGGPLLVLRDEAGAVRFRSSPLASSDLDAGAQQALAHAHAPDSQGRYFTVAIAGEPVRFICVALSAPLDGYLQVGRRLGEVEKLLETVVIASAGLVPLVMMLTSFGGLMIARRALLPIEQIGSTLESIQATDLSRRVQPGTTDTEVTRLSASINRLLDRLQASFTAMRDFTSEVSHQLKTPLTVMKSAAEAAARDGRSERLRQTLAELSVDIDAVTATIGDLRNYALADADSAPAGAAAVNVSDVFMEAAEIIRALAEAHHISCDVSVEGGLLARGNAVRLRQVVLNLGENAVQFTPHGGDIHIAAWREHGHAVLELADTGSGIPPEDMPHILDRHFQARRPNGTRGSGLGLAITRRIVEAHGGEITLASTVGKGTRARVRLPLAS